MAFDLDPSYKQVPERIADFKAKHPDGCLRPADPTRPYWFEEREGQTFIVYAAAAYRSSDDVLPGIGLAWEPFPGKTPYTKQSELQNAETSAWGRAIVAVLASESKAVASAEDVRNRQADEAHQDSEPDQAPCGLCGEIIPGARSDKEPMRAHRVQVHGWERREDGTVAPPEVVPASRTGLPAQEAGGGSDDAPRTEAPDPSLATITDPVRERLTARLDALPDEQRAAVEGVITATWGSLELVPEVEASDVSRLLDDAEKSVKPGAALAARAAKHAKAGAA